MYKLNKLVALLIIGRASFGCNNEVVWLVPDSLHIINNRTKLFNYVDVNVCFVKNYI